MSLHLLVVLIFLPISKAIATSSCHLPRNHLLMPHFQNYLTDLQPALGNSFRRSSTGCDQNVTHAPSESTELTEFRARYEKIKKQASDLKIDPHYFINYISRRFVSRRRWEAALTSNPQNPDPRTIYQPAPLTWDNWQRTESTKVKKQALENLPLSLNILLEWNRSALENIDDRGGNWIERPNNIFVQVDKPYEVEELSGMMDTKLSDGITNAVSGFTPLLCQNEIKTDTKPDTENPDCQFFIKLRQDPNLLQLLYDEASNERWNIFSDYDEIFSYGKLSAANYACWPRAAIRPTPSQTPQCGIIQLLDKDKVKYEIEKIIESVNDFFRCPGSRNTDPVEFAIRIQRRYVAIHPMKDGNGRTSRWLMDYILMRSGLPPLIIQDMSRDVTLPEQKYIKQGYEGIDEALDIMEECLIKHTNKTSKQNYLGACALLKAL